MPSPLETCGNCVFFDINSCDGSPVGTVTIQDQEVSQGFCRTNNGLKLMAKKKRIYAGNQREHSSLRKGLFSKIQNLLLNHPQVLLNYSMV